jgi:predicted enzyme related to lactoylglutathione lyase
MAHRSRLTAVLVDVPAAAHDAATTFWSRAFGRDARRIDDHPEYAFFGQVTPGIEFMVQSLQTQEGSGERPRVHFDIESDDVDAEVARLRDLGAVEVERVHSWVIMRDPVGTTFCVVKVQVQDIFDQHAKTWD